FATLLARFGTRATAAVSWHVSSLRPEVAARLDALSAGLQAHGLSAAAAKPAALRALAGMVARQGTGLAFEKAFLLPGVVFLAVLPLLFFLRVNKRASSPHVELSME